MVLYQNAFLHETFQHRLLLFIAGENGIHKCNAVVFGVQLRNFIPTGQQVHMDTAAVGDELEKLRFCLAEAVDRDLCAVTALRQAWASQNIELPESKIGAIRTNFSVRLLRRTPKLLRCRSVFVSTKSVRI